MHSFSPFTFFRKLKRHSFENMRCLGMFVNSTTGESLVFLLLASFPPLRETAYIFSVPLQGMKTTSSLRGQRASDYLLSLFCGTDEKGN